MAVCDICGASPALHSGPSRLTQEEHSTVRDYYASFDVGVHTGHLSPELMELPYRACDMHKAPVPTEEYFDSEIEFSARKIAAGPTSGSEYAFAYIARERKHLAWLLEARRNLPPPPTRPSRFERSEPL